jgi:hypothetical protein
MTRAIAAIAVALMLVGAVAPPVHAGSLMGTFDGVSTLTPTGTPGIYLQSFTGDGDDDTYGSFTPSSTSMIDFTNPPKISVTDIMFSLDFSQGSLFGTGTGGGTGNGHGMGTFSADIVFTGGTGIFFDAMGSVTIMGTLTQTSPTTLDISDGSYIGSFSVPEPNTLVMAAPALAIGSMVVFRRRRSEMKHLPG